MGLLGIKPPTELSLGRPGLEAGLYSWGFPFLPNLQVCAQPLGKTPADAVGIWEFGNLPPKTRQVLRRIEKPLGIPARGFAAEIPRKPRESASLGLSSALSCSRASLPGPPQTAAPKSKEFPSIRAKTPIYSLRFSSETSKPNAAGFNARRFHDFRGLEPLFSPSSPRLPGFFHNREFNGSTLACTK